MMFRLVIIALLSCAARVYAQRDICEPHQVNLKDDAVQASIAASKTWQSYYKLTEDSKKDLYWMWADIGRNPEKAKQYKIEGYNEKAFVDETGVISLPPGWPQNRAPDWHPAGAGVDCSDKCGCKTRVMGACVSCNGCDDENKLYIWNLGERMTEAWGKPDPRFPDDPTPVPDPFDRCPDREDL